MSFHLKSLNVVKSENNDANCVYCGFPSEYCCLSDGYNIPVCYFCAANFMLNNMSDKDKISFFPDIPINIISHMQRAVAVALHNGEKREIAEKIHQWLFAHAKFVEDSQWNTSSPRAFDSVLSRMSEDNQINFFSELYVVLEPNNIDLLEIEKLKDLMPKPKFWHEHYQETKKLSFEGE